MPRTNKKTRSRFLPPKTHLNEIDAQARSYELQTGNHDRIFVDNSHSNMIVGSEVEVAYPSKISSSSIAFYDEEVVATNGIIAPGRIVAGVSDQWDGPTSGPQADNLIKPFVDHQNPAVDARSEQTWETKFSSMSKIEFDLSTRTPSSFKQQISQSFELNAEGEVTLTKEDNFPMAYFNFDSCTWEGIGVGWPLLAKGYPDQEKKPLELAHDYATYGFSPSILTLPNSSYITGITSSTPSHQEISEVLMAQNYPWGQEHQQNLAGNPTTSFGFPMAPKFHAKSNQTLSMANYIDRPFKVKAIAVDINGVEFEMFNSVTSATAGYNLTSSIFPAVVNNFFIMRQSQVRLPKTRKFSYNVWFADDESAPAWTVPSTQEVSPDEFVEVNTTRDLITYGGIMSHTSDIDYDYEHTNFYMSISESVVTAANARWRRFTLGFGDYDVAGHEYTFRPLEKMLQDFVIPVSGSIATDIDQLSWGEPKAINLKLTPRLPKHQPFSEAGPQAKTVLALGDTMTDDQALPKPTIGSFQYGGRDAGGVFSSTGRSNIPISSEVLDPPTEALGGIPSVLAEGLAPNIYIIGDLISNSSKYTLQMYPTFLPQIKTQLYGAYSNMYPSQPKYQEDEYTLYPTDDLVFGWQLPLVDAVRQRGAALGLNDNWVKMSLPQTHTNNALIDICQITFDGEAKVVFYGNYVDDTELPTDEVGKQTLDSEAVTTKVIGD